MSYRAPDPTGKDREAAADASEQAAYRAEMARMEAAFKAPRRRALFIVLGVGLGLMLVGAVLVILVIGVLASGPSLSGTPGCAPVPEPLPDGGTTWVMRGCPPQATTR
jgi:hypothetical protein